MPDPVSDLTLARIRNIAAERVTRINETTRDAIRGAIVEGVDLGEGAAQLGARISEAASLSPYRGELIARTETMNAWNASAIASYADEGVTLVEAEDGDEDEECRERQTRDNGYGPGIYTLEEAMAEEDHPNGTLSWSPVISADELAQLRQDVREMGWAGEEVSTAQIDEMTSRLVDSAKAAEPGVTADIRAVGEVSGMNPNAALTLENGKTVHTLDFATKTEGSTFRKITGELDVSPGATLQEIEATMRDNLRYTFISENAAQYNAGVRSAIDEMVARGYRPVKATNYWTNDGGYAALNTNWRTASGQVFEVQFNTQKGLETKELLSHPLYEAQRVLQEGSAEWNRLQDQIDEVWRAYRSKNGALGDFGPLRETFPQVKG
jgi:hypothetical protein